MSRPRRSARELWRGGLATTCKLFVAITFIAPVHSFLKSVTLGAVWAGLLVGIVGYAGYWLGHVVTKSICANAEAIPPCQNDLHHLPLTI